MKTPTSLVWLDLEMTGLEPDFHTIIEIGSIVTDSDLNVIAEGPAIVVHQPESELSKMDEWCVDQHGKSGLTEKVRQSQMSLSQAERQVIDFLALHSKPGESPLCGNSIGQDRRFLVKYMPKLNEFFHYRNVDVSSIKELVKRWYPATLQAPEKKKTHHVLDDIRESIGELKYYRQAIFK